MHSLKEGPPHETLLPRTEKKSFAGKIHSWTDRNQTAVAELAEFRKITKF